MSKSLQEITKELETLEAALAQAHAQEREWSRTCTRLRNKLTEVQREFDKSVAEIKMKSTAGWCK